MGDKLFKDITGTRIAKGIENIVDALGGQTTEIYGYRRNRLDSNPKTRIEYINDAVGFTPVTQDFTLHTVDPGSWGQFLNDIHAPAMVKYDGTLDYYLDRTDTTKKFDGTPSDISNTAYEGNAMVEFRKYRYISRKTLGDYDYVFFSNQKVDDSYKDDAFTSLDGESKTPNFFFSMFEGSYDGTRMRSIADTEIMRNTSASTEVSRAQANGSKWYISQWAQLCYIWDLLVLLGKSDNLQSTFGRGICDLGWNDGNNPFGWTVGQTKDKGCFWGTSTGDNCVRTLFIEDLWGRAWDRCAGIINDSGTIKVKLHGPYPAPSTTSADYNSYQVVATAPTANGYVKQILNTEYGFIPTDVTGSDTTYMCDYFYQNAEGVRYAVVGGDWFSGSLCGRSLSLNDSPANAYVTFGARLSLV